jgi:hypothetical protein
MTLLYRHHSHFNVAFVSWAWAHQAPSNLAHAADRGPRLHARNRGKLSRAGRGG